MSGRKRGPDAESPRVRFMRHVEIVGDCWRWTGGGDFRMGAMGSRRCPHARAARILWGVRACRPDERTRIACGNEWCVNPAHAEIVPSLHDECCRGHPLVPANVVGTDGHRRCRTCHMYATMHNRYTRGAGRHLAEDHREALLAYWRWRCLESGEVLPRYFRMFGKDATANDYRRALAERRTSPPCEQRRRYG